MRRTNQQHAHSVNCEFHQIAEGLQEYVRFLYSNPSLNQTKKRADALTYLNNFQQLLVRQQSPHSPHDIATIIKHLPQLLDKENHQDVNPKAMAMAVLESLIQSTKDGLTVRSDVTTKRIAYLVTGLAWMGVTAETLNHHTPSTLSITEILSGAIRHCLIHPDNSTPQPFVTKDIADILDGLAWMKVKANDLFIAKQDQKVLIHPIIAQAAITSLKDRLLPRNKATNIICALALMEFDFTHNSAALDIVVQCGNTILHDPRTIGKTKINLEQALSSFAPQSASSKVSAQPLSPSTMPATKHQDSESQDPSHRSSFPQTRRWLTSGCSIM